ncbi:MAG: alpha amylase C-terminal domain-containing protein, partial [Eubacteriales bacterium]|nr:alpha amylase C-terminal domain-containing protein [Eubacteriales bacterium]
WGTLVFNYGLAEVQSFLLSSAWFWLDEFHADGLRVDAVSSMLYLDFGRPDAVPNDEGSFLHLEAIDFLKSMNAIIREHFPHAIMAAEESTPYPEVTTPVSKGGLGFTHKWNMGWMNDTLSYMEHDYYARGKAHEKLSFSMMYAFSERFILPFSHDEVVHGKKSLLGRMPGDDWRRFASLRACYMYQMSHPGAKLNFMGNEYAPYLEWRYYEELEWFMLEYPLHRAMHGFVRELNHFYLEHKALWEVDDSWEGFLWLDADDRERSVYSYARRALHEEQLILVLLNMTPASYEQYPLRVPYEGRYHLLLNSDDPLYGGSAYQDLDVGRVFLSEDLILKLPVPPLAGMYLLYEGEQEKEA